MRVSAAGNMPLQGLVKPPAKPVVMIRFAAQQHAAAVVLVILGFKAIALSKREGGVEDMGAALAVGMRAFLRLTDTADAYQRG